MAVNSLPSDKYSDWSKLKELADNKMNLTEELKFLLGRVENIAGKGENAGYSSNFSFFYTIFKRLHYQGL